MTASREETIAGDFARHPHGDWAADEGAPSAVALAYDLANSLDERTFYPHSLRHDRRDLLETAADLEEWLRYRGFEAPVSDEDLALARRLRDAVRLVARAHTDAAAIDEARVAFDELAEGLPLRVALGDDGLLRLEGGSGGVRGALEEVLASAVGPSGSEAWSRLKMCAAPDCHWVFFDHSRPHTGRWCNMAVCGNREKTREYRRRHATDARGSR